MNGIKLGQIVLVPIDLQSRRLALPPAPYIGADLRKR